MDQNPQPTPQQQPQQNQQPTQQPQKSNNKKIWIIVGLAACLPMLIIAGILAATVLTGMGGAREKAKDAQVKASVQSLRSSAEIFRDDNGTYQGWTADSQTSNDIKKAGSKIIIQGLSDKTYVIYAELPSSKKLFCADNTNFSGEIASLPTGKTSCR